MSHNMEISAKELRSQVKKVLDTVERGEDVIVTYRGKQRARIQSIKEIEPSSLKTADAPLFGIWADHDASGNVQDYIDSVRADRN